MRKPDLDRLLEAAVAKALGVPLPKQRKMTPVRKTSQHPVKRAA